MTQPQQSPQQPAQGNAGTIVAAAAITLALIAVEARVREDVEDAITDALVVITALLLVALSTPAALISTGTELLSDPTVHAGLTKNLGTAKAKVKASVASGYLAASQIAQAKVTADLKTHGYTAPAELPELDNSDDVIDQDIDTMFGHAQTDIANRVRDAFDGIHGNNPTDARTVAVHKAAEQAGKALQQRAQAAAGTAVQQGSSDAQQALYNQYQNASGEHGLMKRWQVTSTNPCGMCQALDGTQVGINAEFDHNATTDDKDLRPVWRNLLAPPRHPNCRCQLELVTT